MIQKIIEENILDTSLSVWCHCLDGNSMEIYLKTSKYLLNCVQQISCLCQGWLFFLGQQIGLGEGRNLECWEADKQHCPGEEVLAGNSVRVSRCYPNTRRMWWTGGAWSSAWCPLSCIKLILFCFSQSRCFHATQFAAYIFIVELKAVDAFLVTSLNEISCNF